MNCSRWLSVAACGLVLSLAPRVSLAGDPSPESAAPANVTVTVPTEFVAYPRPGDPPIAKDAEPRAMPAGVVVEMYPGAPDGVALPEGAGAPWHGTLEAGGKKTIVAALRGEGDALTILVDGDRDGKIDARKDGKEAYAATIQPKKGPASEWRCEEARLGDVSVRVLAAERPDSFSGTLMLPTVPGKRPDGHALAFVDAKPAEITNAPALPGKASYAKTKVGDRTLYFVAGRGDGDALQVVVDESPDLASAKTLEMEATPMLRKARAIGTRWTSKPATVAGAENATVIVTEMTRNLATTFATQGSRRGVADVDGKPHALYLVDGDLDGRFEGAEDSWWFGAKGANPNPNANNMYEDDAPCLLDGGLVWRLEKVTADGTATVVRASDPDAAGKTLARRAERVNSKQWFPAFAADEKSFARSQKMDVARPRSTTPAPFRFARTFADAQAIAAKEGKPLLVDFEADWCVWCKRLDFHTYVDAEVVKSLDRFTAVKMNNELDPKKSCNAFGWSGIPAVGIFHPDGKPVVFRLGVEEGKPGGGGGPVVDHIPGWLKPERFIGALDAALSAYEDVKAGKPALELPKKAPPPQGDRGPQPAPRPPAPPPTPGAPAAPAAPDAPKTPTPPTAPATPDAPKAPMPPA